MRFLLLVFSVPGTLASESKIMVRGVDGASVIGGVEERSWNRPNSANKARYPC